MLRGVSKKKLMTPWPKLLLRCPVPLYQTEERTFKHNANVPEITYALARGFHFPSHLPCDSTETWNPVYLDSKKYLERNTTTFRTLTEMYRTTIYRAIERQ